jgi:aminoglycoside 6-adenylyltransferase
VRSEHEMLTLIVSTAQADDRIRAVILNGSRANPDAPRDLFQDYDVVYVVTEVASFKQDPGWIARFGQLMILQLPDAMGDAPLRREHRYAYLMQFADGNRLDLTLLAVSRLGERAPDSQSLLLLDKDGIMPPFPPPSDRDYWPRPPTAQQFADCCNEFWWVCPYVAKGLWRAEIVYAKAMLDGAVREQLMHMLAWYVGVQTQFTRSPGKLGKYLQQRLEPDLWDRLLLTYADAGYEPTWTALQAACDLFRLTALRVAAHFGFEYPHSDDQAVSAHLSHVRRLPRDAAKIY